jgi:hypothetical protein
MSDALRRLARDRAGGRCEYCELPDSLPPLDISNILWLASMEARQ